MKLVNREFPRNSLVVRGSFFDTSSCILHFLSSIQLFYGGYIPDLAFIERLAIYLIRVGDRRDFHRAAIANIQDIEDFDDNNDDLDPGYVSDNEVPELHAK